MNRLLAFGGVFFGYVAAVYMSLGTVAQALLILMGVDIIFGAINAYGDKTLNSQTAFSGVSKKIAIVGIVLVAHAIQPMLQPTINFPIAATVAAYYVFVEALSVIENADKIGIPIPQFLRDAITTAAGTDPQKLDPPPPGPAAVG